MFTLFIVYANLLATCSALGAIIATDLQLLGKLGAPRRHSQPPGQWAERLIVAALAALYVTGGLRLWLGLQQAPGDLLTPQLIGQLVLVGALTLHAAALHHPVLARRPTQRMAPPPREYDGHEFLAA